MASKNYVVTRTGTYGKTGDVVELNIEQLSERQSVMLKPYVKPEGLVDEGKELKDAKALIAELQAKLKK
mgnify:CR=1 FL=1